MYKFIHFIDLLFECTFLCEITNNYCLNCEHTLTMPILPYKNSTHEFKIDFLLIITVIQHLLMSCNAYK